MMARRAVTRTALLLIAFVLALPGCARKQAPGRVLVIGLDGGTFDLIGPWLDDGTLPQLAALRAEGVSGALESVVPCLSAGAWTTAITGCNPGKHGIYDFQRRLPGQLVMVSETSRSRRMPGVWAYFGAEKRRSVIINIPLTAPPEPLVGEMISGFPYLSKHGYTYPPQLQQQLGGYILDEMNMSLAKGHENEFRDDVFAAERERDRVAEELFKKRDWDLFWVVFTGTDRLQHYFWKFMDPEHPYYTPEGGAEWGSAIKDFWKAADEYVGRLVSLADENTTIVVLSDHGFGPVYRELRIQNLLRRPANAGEEPILTTYSLDVDASCLYFSRKGREPGGVLDDAAYSAAREEVAKRLLAYVDPETGVHPVQRVFRAEEEYQGLYLTKAPDLIADPAPTYWITRGDETKDYTDPPCGLPTFTFSGWHRMNGMLIVRGPGIRRAGEVEGAKLIDIVPTVLYSAGIGIPDGLDGKVLDSVYEPDFLSRHPKRVFEGTIELPEALPKDVEENIKSLPYVR
jgi:predicted AlkP superfamily phosphohydrolase/phosphomutase